MLTPPVERELVVNNGIILRKYFLDVSQDEQRRRFEARIKKPVKHWKLSPMDTNQYAAGGTIRRRTSACSRPLTRLRRPGTSCQPTISAAPD